MRLLGAVGKYCRMRSILGFTVSCLLVFVVFYFSDDLNFYWRCEAGEAGGIGVASENGHGARCVSQVQIVHTQLYSLFYVRSPLSRALANKHPDSDREVHGGVPRGPTLLLLGFELSKHTSYIHDNCGTNPKIPNLTNSTMKRTHVTCVHVATLLTWLRGDQADPSSSGSNMSNEFCGSNYICPRSIRQKSTGDFLFGNRTRTWYP
ncbi:MAG: hypothetical protein NXY57DRAFT_374417 [Lentinula lateritia]|nr:MAG: hypothetical protein NXY57DRAFT_374417 [Lentinula lateritia]